MTRETQRRLQKLERQFQRTKREHLEAHLSWLIDLAIAYYLGNPTSNESVSEPFARALGYRSIFEFKKASERELKLRFALAKDKLYAKFGVSKEDDRDTISDAFMDMIKGFSESYMRRVEDGCTRWATAMLASFGRTA